MGQIALSLPQVGQTNASQEPLIPADFATIQTVINGNLDATNLSATLAQAASVNQSGQTVKGAVSIPAPESRTNVAYGTLPTPDQVTGIALPPNGLISVWYQATWQESVGGAAFAAIFIGANQLKSAAGGTTPVVQEISVADTGVAGIARPLGTQTIGLSSGTGITGAYTGDVTTGQLAGFGGPCQVFAAAGTYTISVQFKASSGSVTVSNRTLRVQALAFS